MIAHQASAVPNKELKWHAIKWRKAHSIIRRLQARIVKAVQENRWGKVKALQHLLTRSFSAKVLAIKRVTENPGKKTPGVDKEVWDSPIKKEKAIFRLKQRGYKAQPLRRVYIPKNKNQKRGLGIPTLIDRAQQALHLLALDPMAETISDANTYGFRIERSAADAIDQCFRVLSKQYSAQWILEGDIRACYDRISHQWLMDNIPMNKSMLHQWLKAGYIDRQRFHPTQEGTPQGGIASPVIARLALNGLERKLREKYPTATAKSKKAKVNITVYADDCAP